jgi:molecular chaperone DnaK (HSP70)
MIYKNTSLQARASDAFYTYVANQKTVAIQICENLADEEEARAGVSTAESTLLATQDLPLPPGLPAGAPIKITFEMTAEGLLTATATEPSSRNGVTITIETGASALSPEEKRRQEKRCSELIVE